MIKIATEQAVHPSCSLHLKEKRHICVFVCAFVYVLMKRETSRDRLLCACTHQTSTR